MADEPRRPLRITGGGWKAVYVIAAIVIWTGTGIATIGILPPSAVWVLVSAIQITAIVVGTRIFRGADEPVAPRRAWWRATARPPAGFVIAAIVIGLRFITVLQGTDVFTPADIVVDLGIATFYLHSSMRLLAARTA